MKAEVQHASERLAAAEKQLGEVADVLRSKDTEIGVLKDALTTLHRPGVPTNDIVPVVDTDALKVAHAAELASLREQHVAELALKDRQFQEVHDAAASLREQVWFGTMKLLFSIMWYVHVA